VTIDEVPKTGVGKFSKKDLHARCSAFTTPAQSRNRLLRHFLATVLAVTAPAECP
jgi:hypothetical protein